MFEIKFRQGFVWNSSFSLSYCVKLGSYCDELFRYSNFFLLHDQILSIDKSINKKTTLIEWKLHLNKQNSVILIVWFSLISNTNKNHSYFCYTPNIVAYHNESYQRKSYTIKAHRSICFFGTKCKNKSDFTFSKTSLVASWFFNSYHKEN